MKIWCCLCFTEDEEDEEKKRMTLIDDESDGSVRSDEDVQMQFGLDLEMFDEPLQRPFPDLMTVLRESDDMGPPVRRAPRWRSLSRETRQYEGESSSSSGVEIGDGGSSLAIDDLQHKRAKVFSTSPPCYYGTVRLSDPGCSSSLREKNCNIRMGSFASPANEMLYHNFMWNNGGDESHSDPTSGNDDGNDNGTSRMEDFEVDVRLDLTDDLLHMVFSFLDYVDLCRAAIVCRQWRAASAHEDFWRCLNFENRRISIEQFEDVCRRYPNATEVNLYGVRDMHLLVMKAVLLRNLEALTLGRYPIGDTFFHAIVDCSMLKRLNVYDAILGTGVQEIPINHDQLRYLELNKCRMMRVSIRCPQLVNLSLKRSNMGQAVLNCPLLTLLDIAACHKLSDAAIRLAVTSCPQLESLDMSNCSCVSDETLREIALSCANLCILNSSYCPNISLESVRLPMLTDLKLHSCEGITSASMAAISHSYKLEVLELDNCNLLTSVSLDLPRLQNIRLVHCRKFVELNLRTIMLSSITVSNCAALNRINVTSDSLQKLSLQKQENLTTLVLNCLSLQEVDLTDCESLTNSICEVFSDGGGCPVLKSLVLDNCEVCELGYYSIFILNWSIPMLGICMERGLCT